MQLHVVAIKLVILNLQLLNQNSDYGPRSVSACHARVRTQAMGQGQYQLVIPESEYRLWADVGI